MKKYKILMALMGLEIGGAETHGRGGGAFQGS